MTVVIKKRNGARQEVTYESLIKKAGLLAAALLLTAGPAGASTMDVKVPFSFVVHGQTLPAGQYLDERRGWCRPDPR